MPRPTQVPTGLVSGLRVRGFHLLRPRVPARSTDPDSTWRRSYNPGTCLATPPVWAPPRSLAATGGIVVTFSSWRYLDVSVPTVRLPLCGMPGSLPAGCPIRTSADHWAFAPPRGFSQLVTSFFASESQGIPHAPLVDSVISLTSSAKLHLLFCHLTFTSFSPQADGSARLESSITLVILSFLLCVFSLTSALMSQRSCFQPCHCSLFLVRCRVVFLAAGCLSR